MKLYRESPLLPDSMSREERVALVQEIAQTAEYEFQQKYFSLGEWFDRYDALHLLAYCCSYFVCHPAGVDPELGGGLDFHPYHLEILQAFALMQERSSSDRPLGLEAEGLLDVMSAVGQAAVNRDLKAGVDQVEGDSEWNFILSNMRTQTMAVRNPGYPHHIHQIVRDLAETVREDFVGVHGVDPVRLVDALFRLPEMASTRLGAHLERVAHFYREKSCQAVAAAYVESFPDVGDFDADRLFHLAGRNLHSMKAMLVYHSDLRLADCFTFTLDDVAEAYGQCVDREAIQTVVDKLTFEFGDLRDWNKEWVILDNPVWKRPFIEIDDETYFLALAGHIPHYASGLLEGLVIKDGALEQKYRDRKARYLEDEVERLFRAGFPGGQIYRGSMWDDGAGGKGENDLTMVLGSVAIVVEAKSGSLSPHAQRGAHKRLVDTVRQLIVEPADQAYRFVRLLQGTEGPRSFTTKSGAENTIDVSGVRYFLPLTVTMEQFGLLSNLRNLADAGIGDRKVSELAQVLSLTDLMVIFEVLDLQSEKVHYFFRRRELGARMRLHGYEMDVLAFYLDRGFNVGEVEFSGNNFVDLTLASKRLDHYFVGQQLGVAVDKPALRLAPWWTRALQRLDTDLNEDRLDAASCSLMSPSTISKSWSAGLRSSAIARGAIPVKTRAPGSNSSPTPAQRQFCVALYPYLSAYREKKDEVMVDFLSRDSAQQSRGAVCIGVNLDRSDTPYAVVALTPEPDLLINFSRPSPELAPNSLAGHRGMPCMRNYVKFLARTRFRAIDAAASAGKPEWQTSVQTLPFAGAVDISVTADGMRNLR